MHDTNQLLKEIDKLAPDDLRKLQTAVTKRLEALESEVERERQFDEELLRRGVISSIPDRSKSTPLDQRPAPIRVKGPPLSEIIIQERR